MGMIWVGYRRDEAAARELLEDPDGIDELLESDDDVASVDPAAMMQEQIYPTIWLESDIFDGYLLPAFQRLRTFYAAAAAADEAVIQTLC